VMMKSSSLLSSFVIVSCCLLVLSAVTYADDSEKGNEPGKTRRSDDAEDTETSDSDSDSSSTSDVSTNPVSTPSTIHAMFAPIPYASMFHHSHHHQPSMTHMSAASAPTFAYFRPIHPPSPPMPSYHPRPMMPFQFLPAPPQTLMPLTIMHPMKRWDVESHLPTPSFNHHNLFESLLHSDHLEHPLGLIDSEPIEIEEEDFLRETRKLQHNNPNGIRRESLFEDHIPHHHHRHHSHRSYTRAPVYDNEERSREDPYEPIQMENRYHRTAGQRIYRDNPVEDRGSDRFRDVEDSQVEKQPQRNARNDDEEYDVRDRKK